MMARMSMGNTGISVEQFSFGALPLQRISMGSAIRLLRKAADGGIEYFDTGRSYTDSEEKLGNAFSGIRDRVILSTKTKAQDADGFRQDLDTSLIKLKTDYIDIYQFHNPSYIPLPGDGSGMYEAMVQARDQGKIRHIGITSHRIDVAEAAVASGRYETLMFPYNYLSNQRELKLCARCLEKGMAFIPMKALSGGLLSNSAVVAAWFAGQKGVFPVFGIQRESELDEFLSYIARPPEMTEEFRAVIEKDRRELTGEFCRGCGYCMPCPQGIIINYCARMSLLLRRSPSEKWLRDEKQEMMNKIDECTECRSCASKCPYGLDTPKLLKRNLRDYREVLAGKPLGRF